MTAEALRTEEGVLVVSDEPTSQLPAVSYYPKEVESSAVPEEPLTKRMKLALSFDSVRSGSYFAGMIWVGVLLIAVIQITSGAVPVYYPVISDGYNLYQFLLRASSLGIVCSILTHLAMNVGSIILAKGFTLPKRPHWETVLTDTLLVTLASAALGFILFWGRTN